MRAFTSPLFPAQVDGAVTLQAAIDAREGDRLPLELALYIAAELGKQVAELQAMGKAVGALDPSKVWCTRQGGVWVPEASDAQSGGPALGKLVYRLLSGSVEISAWPPSYFNPGVDPSVDAAVMAAVNGEGPEEAMVAAVSAASGQLEPRASIDGMARLVLAVPDEPVPPPPVVVRPPTQVEVPAAVAAPTGWKTWLTRENAPPLAVALMVLLFVAMILGTATHREATVAVEAPAPVAVAPVSASRAAAIAMAKPAAVKTFVAKTPAKKVRRGR